MKLVTLIVSLALGVLPSTPSRVEYTASGGTQFAFTFKTFSTSHVKVYLTDALQSTGYSVSLNANQDSSPGGTVTFTAAPAAGMRVRIERTLPVSNDSVWTSFSKAKSLELDLDRAAARDQQLERRIIDHETKANSIAATANNDTPITATGTSAARPLKDIAADVVSVKAFGCVGDGATDDTNCLNAAGGSGKRVRVSPGTYKATTTVQLSAGTSFVCDDPALSVLTFSGTPEPTSAAAIRLNASGAGIERCGINVTAGAYQRTVNHRAGYTFTRGNFINVSTSDLVATAHYVVFATTGATMYGIIIEGNDIQRTNIPWGDALQIAQCPGVRVVGNRVHDSTLSQPTATCGAQPCGQQSWGIYVSSASYGALVQGNIVENCNHSGIHFNDAGAVVSNVGRRMIGNYVHDVTYVCASVDYTDGAVVSGNWFSRCDIPLNVVGGYGVTISGNHIEDVQNASPPGAADQPMLSIGSGASGVMVTGNTFGTRGTALMSIDTSGADVLVVGNFFGPDRPQNVITGSSGATGLQVVGNRIETTTDLTAAKYVINVSGADTLIDDNVINLTTVGVGIRLNGTAQVASKNRIVGGVGGVWLPSSSAVNCLVDANYITSTSGAAVSDSGTNTIKHRNVVDGKPAQASGRSTQSGTGAQTAFTIAHGLSAAPTTTTVTAGSSAANGAFYVTSDATNIIVTYAAAPANGSNNVVLNWSAESN